MFGGVGSVHSCKPSGSPAVPVLCEHTDSSWVVGAVGHIESLDLGHPIQEEATDPLLALWESIRAQTEQNELHHRFIQYRNPEI